MGFLSEPGIERIDGVLRERGSEGIEHRAKFDVGDGAVIVGIVLLEALSPEVLTESVVWLVLRPIVIFISKSALMINCNSLT